MSTQEMGVELIKRRRHNVDVFDGRLGVRSAAEQFDLLLGCRIDLDHLPIDLLPAAVSEPTADSTGIAGQGDPDLRWKASNLAQLINRAVCHQAPTAHDEDAVRSLAEFGERM